MFYRYVMFLLVEGITEFESHSFPTFSMYCLYKNDFTSNISKFKFFPSLFIISFFIFFSILTKYSTFVPILVASQVMVVVKNIPANAGDIRSLRFDP